MLISPFNTIRSVTTVEQLLVYLKPIRVNTLFDDIAERFQAAKDMSVLPVINTDSSVAGVIFRVDFLTLYASRYGKELHGKKPSSAIMQTNTLQVDIKLPLNKLNQYITRQNDQIRQDNFIITCNNKYKGMGSFLDLLKEITEMQITFAKHMNPLSNLPGNVLISQQIHTLIESGKNFVFCYFDLDNFKPDNDIYGFSKGDDVIKETAILLRTNADENSDFIGHIGGDDFVVIFRSNDWQQRRQNILDQFTLSLGNFYSKEHIELGGISALDRKSLPLFYPLLSISITALNTLDFDTINSEDQLVKHATLAKSIAKKTPSNSFYQALPNTHLIRQDWFDSYSKV